MHTPAVAWSLLGLCLAPAAGQSPAKHTAGPDPYTAGEPQALQRAGYVSLGPFPFGKVGTTAQAEQLLGDEPLAWIETAHFQIGCSLAAVALKPDERTTLDMIAMVRGELRQLATRLPKVKPQVRQLDPWLRAHLVAARAEAVYAEVQSLLAVDDSHFPAAPGDDATDPNTFRGVGPHLGMAGKFRILLVQRSSSHARFTRAGFGSELTDPVRWNDAGSGSLYFCGSEEAALGLLHCEPALRTHLTYNLAVNLYTGYRAYSHDLPAWLPTGLGHWHARRICPEFPVLERRDKADTDRRSSFWQWEKRMPGLARNAAFEPLETFLVRANPGDFRLEQHMQAWSLADFLTQQKRAQLAAFLRLMKAPFHARYRTPTLEELRDRQLEAVRTAFGLDLTHLESEWRAHILQPRDGNDARK